MYLIVTKKIHGEDVRCSFRTAGNSPYDSISVCVTLWTRKSDLFVHCFLYILVLFKSNTIIVWIILFPKPFSKDIKDLPNRKIKSQKIICLAICNFAETKSIQSIYVCFIAVLKDELFTILCSVIHVYIHVKLL
jgi:hypothetical protein